MAAFFLSAKERKDLERLVVKTTNANILRRVQVLLWLDKGESARNVADLLYVSRSVVYKWIGEFQKRATLDINEWISVGIRGGRSRLSIRSNGMGLKG
jgi:transposase